MNELIKQIHKEIGSPRSNEVKESSHRRCTRRGEGLTQSSHSVRDTCDKNVHSIVE